MTIGAGWTEAEVEEILRRHAGRKGGLLPILNDVQAASSASRDLMVLHGDTPVGCRCARGLSCTDTLDDGRHSWRHASVTNG